MKPAISNTVPRARRALLGGLGCLCGWGLAACVGTGGLAGSENTAPPCRDPGMSMQTAGERIAIGKTTQAEVLAALGPANELKFDSGFEVWVYRARLSSSQTDKAEFVILFAPSGIVKKTRLRPAYDRSMTSR